MGSHVTELIAEAVVATTIDCTVEEMANAIYAHPTLSKATAGAARGVRAPDLRSAAADQGQQGGAATILLFCAAKSCDSGILTRASVASGVSRYRRCVNAQ